MRLPTPPYFSLSATVRSSFLHRLSPLHLDTSGAPVLDLPLALPDGTACDLTIDSGERAGEQAGERAGEQAGAGLRVTVTWDGDKGRRGGRGARGRAAGAGAQGSGAGLTATAVEEYARDTVMSMLGLGHDLRFFHSLTDRDPGLGWVRRGGYGRFLRSATAFEDLVKALLCGTGSAALGASVSERLCTLLGPRAPSGRHAFPSLQTMVGAPQTFYTEELGAGRLARPLWALVQRCHQDAYPEAIRRGQVPAWDRRRAQRSRSYFDDRIREELDWSERLETFLLSLPGIGLRASGLLLPLCGCYDVAFLSTPVCATFRRRVLVPRDPRAGKLDQPQIQKILSRWLDRFAHYRGLALWLLLYAPVEESVRAKATAYKNLRSARPGLLIATC